MYVKGILSNIFFEANYKKLSKITVTDLGSLGYAHITFLSKLVQLLQSLLFLNEQKKANYRNICLYLWCFKKMFLIYKIKCHQVYVSK